MLLQLAKSLSGICLVKPRSFTEDALLPLTSGQIRSCRADIADLPCIDVDGELARQARVALALGSPLVAGVLEAVRRQLWRGRHTSALVAQWHGDLAQTALALRINGALHALARQGGHGYLSALYQGQHADFDGAVGEAIAKADHLIAKWILGPTQTNEVARAAAIHAALMVLAAKFSMPFELLELGASSGLNLNLAHYAYRLGDVRSGDLSSPVEITPQWRGPVPANAAVKIANASGVDLNPLDPTDLATRELLVSYVWADQPRRIEWLEKALSLAQSFKPTVDIGNAAPWLADRLAMPQLSGQCRVVMHSMVMQYLPAAPRTRLGR